MHAAVLARAQNLVEVGDRHQRRPAERRPRRVGEVGVEPEQPEVAGVGQPDVVVRRAGRRRRAAVEIGGQEARHRRRLLEADRAGRRAGRHRGAVERAGLRARELVAGKDIDRVVVSVRPDPEFRIVREVGAVVELVAVVRAGRVRAGRHRDALRGVGERLVELELADQPAVGEVVVQHHRIAAVLELRGGAAVLAQAAEPLPQRVDRRRAQLQRAVALAVHRDRDVHHLDELRRADRAVGVRRDEREPEDAPVVGRALALEHDRLGHALQRPGEHGRHRVGAPGAERRPGRVRLDPLGVRPAGRGAAGGHQLAERQ